MKRTFLLIDIGNTRIKWAVCCEDVCQNTAFLIPQPPPWVVHCAAAKLPATPEQSKAVVGAFWRDCLRQISLEPCEQVHVVVACVNQPVWLAHLDRCVCSHGFQFHVVTAQPQCLNLCNLYDDPAKLGVDRFCGLLAVAQNEFGRAVVLVSVGTASTVDALDATGQFLGGYILPGPRLMAQSLHTQTAQLPLLSGALQSDLPVVWQATPRNTEQAMMSGVVAAQVGAVQTMLTHVQAQTGQVPLCLLSGGDSHWLKPLLPEARTMEAIVLQGLRYWAWANLQQVH